MSNKIIAQRELEIFGGEPKVIRYWDDPHTKSIDILQCLNVPQKGVQSCGTIGVNAIDIGLENNKKALRVEILGVADVVTKEFGNIIASTAFQIMYNRKCFPGYIIKGTVSQHIPDSAMKHIMLTNPFIWENAKNVSLKDCYVTWLMAVPISEEEFEYAKAYGVDALETVFEEKEIDIYNIYRTSSV